jgi:hypothetical protein
MTTKKTHAFTAFGRGGKKSSVSIPYQYCQNCGLILLKNEASQKAAKASCRDEWPTQCIVYQTKFKQKV